MTLQVWFWLLMALWLIFGAWDYRVPNQPWVRGGGYLLMFLLFALLGWKVFGSPVQ